MQSPVLHSVGNLVHCFVALILRWRSGVVNSEHIRFYFLNTFYYFPPVGRRSIVMTVFVWVSVCVFVCPRMFLYNYTSDQIFTKNFVHATYGMSSKLESDVCSRLQVAPSGESYGGNRRPGRK